MHINKSNYFSEINRIGFDKLSPVLKHGHSMVERITKDGTRWEVSNPTLSEVINKQMELLNKFLSKAEAKDTKSLPVSNLPETPETKKATPERKEKKARASKGRKPERRVKSAKKAVKAEKQTKPKKEKRKSVKKAVVKRPSGLSKLIVKPAITVKKYSLELQHIKRYLNMEGKNIKTGKLTSLSRAISKALNEGSYVNHKELLNGINNQLALGCENLERTGQESVDVKLTPEFKAKCQDIVASAKVRMRTEYLAGPENSNQEDLGCDCEKKK